MGVLPEWCVFVSHWNCCNLLLSCDISWWLSRGLAYIYGGLAGYSLKVSSFGARTAGPALQTDSLGPAWLAKSAWGLWAEGRQLRALSEPHV